MVFLNSLQGVLTTGYSEILLLVDALQCVDAQQCVDALQNMDAQQCVLTTESQ
jgi:hypothetical protein